MLVLVIVIFHGFNLSLASEVVECIVGGKEDC